MCMDSMALSISLPKCDHISFDSAVNRNCDVVGMVHGMHLHLASMEMEAIQVSAAVTIKRKFYNKTKSNQFVPFRMSSINLCTTICNRF